MTKQVWLLLLLCMSSCIKSKIIVHQLPCGYQGCIMLRFTDRPILPQQSGDSIYLIYDNRGVAYWNEADYKNTQVARSVYFNCQEQLQRIPLTMAMGYRYYSFCVGQDTTIRQNCLFRQTALIEDFDTLLFGKRATPIVPLFKHKKTLKEATAWEEQFKEF
jgi:hypothetical protein